MKEELRVPNFGLKQSIIARCRTQAPARSAVLKFPPKVKLVWA